MKATPSSLSGVDSEMLLDAVVGPSSSPSSPRNISLPSRYVSRNPGNPGNPGDSDETMSSSSDGDMAADVGGVAAGALCFAVPRVALRLVPGPVLFTTQSRTRDPKNASQSRAPSPPKPASLASTSRVITTSPRLLCAFFGSLPTHARYKSVSLLESAPTSAAALAYASVSKKRKSVSSCCTSAVIP